MYELRPASIERFEALYAIHRAAMERYVAETWGGWDDAWQREHFREHWPPSKQEIVSAGEVVGFLELEVRPGQVWVTNIELSPKVHGQGIGSAILRDVMRQAAASGSGVGLQVLRVNTAARRLYERLGFRRTGENQTHYLMAWESPMSASVAERPITAFLDGEDSPTISNPIHSTEVAAQYGFRGALVGGVTVYGWFTPAILDVLGERWLGDGWAEVRFRRPVFPGDEVTARVTATAGGADVAMVLPDGDSAIVGTVGVGRAPWFEELRAPQYEPAEPLPGGLPALTLETAPKDSRLRPQPVPYSVEDANTYARNLQRDDSGRFTGDAPLIHPGWIAARMTPLLKHSFEYGPSIHIASRIQHLATARAGQEFTMVGHFLRAYEQKGHHVAELDGSLFTADGTEVARMRHTTIFRIRPAGG